MVSSRSLFFMAASLCVVLMPASSRANEPKACLTPAQLKRMSVCDLDRLFEQASVSQIPTGFMKGQVLLMTDARFPRLKASLSSAAWKGKHFDPAGDFINQWPGFKAVSGHAEIGLSQHDGKPCIVATYPRGAAVFGNTRDELREVSPGVFLGRLYDVCPCPRFKGYFVIAVTCK